MVKLKTDNRLLKKENTGKFPVAVDAQGPVKAETNLHVTLGSRVFNSPLPLGT